MNRNRATREERLEYLRTMRAYLDAPPGQGVEPRPPAAAETHRKLPAVTVRKTARGLARPEGGISDAAAQLIALALKDMLREK